MSNIKYLCRWWRFGNEDRFIAKNFLYAMGITALGVSHYNLRLRTWHILQEIKKVFTCDELANRKFYILDAGCKTGQSTIFLSRVFGNAIMKGVDYNTDYIACARYKLSKMLHNVKNRVSFDLLDLRELKGFDEYDLILCSEVLEHIEEDEVVMRNLYNGLKKGGLAIFTVPVAAIPPASGHVPGRYSYEDFKSKLITSGFNIYKSCYFSSRYVGEIGWLINFLCKTKFSLVSSALRFMLHPLLRFLCILDYWISPTFGTHLLFVTKK